MDAPRVIGYAVARTFVDSTKLLRQLFGDDLDLAIIVFSLVICGKTDPGLGDAVADRRPLDPVQPVGRGVSVYALCKLSGLTRSKVRRKIRVLMDRGFVFRDEAGRYHLVNFRQDPQAEFETLLKLYRAIRDVVETAEAQLGHDRIARVLAQPERYREE